MRLKDKNNRMFSAYFSTLVIPLIIVGIIVLAILMGSVSKRMRTLNKKIVNQTVDVFENETEIMYFVQKSVEVATHLSKSFSYSR